MYNLAGYEGEKIKPLIIKIAAHLADDALGNDKHLKSLKVDEFYYSSDKREIEFSAKTKAKIADKINDLAGDFYDGFKLELKQDAANKSLVNAIYNGG